MSTMAEVPSHAFHHPRDPVVGVLGAIGDTPLVGLRRYLLRPDIDVWAKLEAANPGGSAKDRPAARMLEAALEQGLINAETTVIESSSGNMGIGLAQACRYHGIGLICVVDVRAHETSLRTMRALGADVRVVSPSAADAGNLLAARLRLVAELIARTPNAFWPNQYANQANAAAHASGTMREIDEALGGAVDYVFVATSTTGTLRGCCDYVREHARTTKVVAVDSAGSALFGGCPGPRLLPGFGAGVETQLSVGVEFDRLERVSDLDCVVGCRRLAQREAILAGASSGGVVIVLERMADEMAPGTSCAVILPDRGTGYLETVYDDAWVTRTLGCKPDTLAGLVDGGLLESTCSIS
ncbi:MAG TPA: 2,3-diaminopropionate biosynthesis protein SbnA [Solirubrobacteraceae bacterium]